MDTPINIYIWYVWSTTGVPIYQLIGVHRKIATRTTRNVSICQYLLLRSHVEKSSLGAKKPQIGNISHTKSNLRNIWKSNRYSIATILCSSLSQLHGEAEIFTPAGIKIWGCQSTNTWIVGRKPMYKDWGSYPTKKGCLYQFPRNLSFELVTVTLRWKNKHSRLHAWASI